MVAFRGRPGRTMAPQRPASAGAGLPGRTIPHSARAPGPFPPRRPPQSSRLSPRPGLPAGPRLGGTIAPGDGEGGCCPQGGPGQPPAPPGRSRCAPGGTPGTGPGCALRPPPPPRSRAPPGAQRPRVGHAAGAPSPPRETKPAPRWGCGGGCPNTPSPLTMVRAAAPGRPPVRSGAAGKRLWGGHGRGPFHSTGHPPAPPSLLPPSAAQALGAGPGPPPGGAGGVRVRVRVSCLPPPRPGLGAAAALRTVLRPRDRAEAGCLGRGGGTHTLVRAPAPLVAAERWGGQGAARTGRCGRRELRDRSSCWQTRGRGSSAPTSSASASLLSALPLCSRRPPRLVPLPALDAVPGGLRGSRLLPPPLFAFRLPDALCFARFPLPLYPSRGCRLPCSPR